MRPGAAQREPRQNVLDRRAIALKYRGEGDRRLSPSSLPGPTALRWEAGFLDASRRPRTRSPSQIQLGQAEAKEAPEGSSHPRTTLSIFCSLPPSFCGHDPLLCLSRAISAAKLSAAVCKQPPTLPAKRRQPPACFAGGSHKLPGLAPGC